MLVTIMIRIGIFFTSTMKRFLTTWKIWIFLNNFDNNFKKKSTKYSYFSTIYGLLIMFAVHNKSWGKNSSFFPGVSIINPRLSRFQTTLTAGSGWAVHLIFTKKHNLLIANFVDSFQILCEIWRTFAVIVRVPLSVHILLYVWNIKDRLWSIMDDFWRD